MINTVSESVCTKRNVRQDSVLSPLIFNFMYVNSSEKNSWHYNGIKAIRNNYGQDSEV